MVTNKNWFTDYQLYLISVRFFIKWVREYILLAVNISYLVTVRYLAENDFEKVLCGFD